MKLRDRMIYAGIVVSDLKRRHKAHIREFYRDLLHVCDDHGRFNADPALLRAVLYATIPDRVSVRDVTGYLSSLHVAHDIKLYTVRGRGYGKVTKWRQTRLKTLVADYPDEEDDPGGDLFNTEGRKEGGSPATAGRATPPGTAAPFPKPQSKSAAPKLSTVHCPPSSETDNDWLARLVKEWPGLDVPAQLRKAHRKRQGDVERGWFERVWLPGVTPAAPHPSSVLRPSVESAPAGWRTTLEQLYPGNAISADPARTWASVDPATRAKVAAATTGRAA